MGKRDKLVIEYPENLKLSGKEIIITIDENESFQKEKLDLMKKAATDALFLKDIEDTVSDFEESDFESAFKYKKNRFSLRILILY